MKAIVQRRYGTAADLKLEEIDEPVVRDDEVLVQVKAASVHPDVWHVVTGLPHVLRLFGAGFWKPKNPVPGTDLSGVVVKLGKLVTRFREGDEVFGESLRGFQWENGGTYAEFASAPENGLAHKPSNVSFEEAASVPTAGHIAIPNLLAQGQLRAGQHVLINGAAGGVGSIALQVAKAEGAEVTAVDRTDKLELLRDLGADHVIDYTRTDFTTGTERYDMVFDVPGNHSFKRCCGVLSPDGKYVLIGHDHFGTRGRRVLGSLPRMIGLMLRTPFSKHLPKAGFSMPDRQASMQLLQRLLESKQLTPKIARSYPLEQAGEALLRLQQGDLLGRIVLSI